MRTNIVLNEDSNGELSLPVEEATKLASRITELKIHIKDLEKDQQKLKTKLAYARATLLLAVSIIKVYDKDQAASIERCLGEIIL